MIILSNGEVLKYVVASGALAFDGKGWIWEWILVWLGLIKREYFTIVLKSLSLEEMKGNLRWWKPWDCVRLIVGGAVNKVGLTNRGFMYWLENIAPHIDFRRFKIVVSLYGNEEQVTIMGRLLNLLPLVAVELNPSCPNTGKHLQTTAMIIRMAKALKAACRHPIILKVSVDQDYMALAEALVGVVEAISFNSVRWEMVFPGKRSPLWRLEKRVGGGGGGVSGKPAQKFNWPAVKALARQGLIPVIAPDVMKFDDMRKAKEELGARAVSFGTIHLPTHPVWLKPWTLFTNPCKPTRFVRREMKLCKSAQMK